MSGRPRFRAAIEMIEEWGGEEFVLEQLMDGQSLKKIATVMDVSRGLLYRWLHQEEDRWDKYNEAREVGAHAMVDSAFEILEGATATSISVDRERANIRKWLAERANRKDFGSEKTQQVHNVMNISEMHLVAVQQAPKDVPALPPEEVDYEIVAGDEVDQPMRLKDGMIDA